MYRPGVLCKENIGQFHFPARKLKIKCMNVLYGNDIFEKFMNKYSLKNIESTN